MYPIFHGKLKLLILFSFLALLPNFYFGKGDWALDYACTLFRDFTKISSFSRLFNNSQDTSYIQFIVIMI